MPSKRLLRAIRCGRPAGGKSRREVHVMDRPVHGRFPSKSQRSKNQSSITSAPWVVKGLSSACSSPRHVIWSSWARMSSQSRNWSRPCCFPLAAPVRGHRWQGQTDGRARVFLPCSCHAPSAPTHSTPRIAATCCSWVPMMVAGLPDALPLPFAFETRLSSSHCPSPTHAHARPPRSCWDS